MRKMEVNCDICEIKIEDKKDLMELKIYQNNYLKEPLDLCEECNDSFNDMYDKWLGG